MVESERRRNLSIVCAMLPTILAAGLALLHFTRAARNVANPQMNIVAGVSHKLRSPLAAIRTAAFNLQREGFAARPEQARRYGELINTESGRLERLIDNVLQFAAGTVGRPRLESVSIDMRDLLETELEYPGEVIAASGMAVERGIAASLPQRHADEDASEIRLADRGPDIPETERSRIYEPFFRDGSAIRDQARGTGLGLSLAAQIARSHGGSISAGGHQDAGAEFIITLPAARGRR